MRAHHKRSKHRTDELWLRTYLSPTFETGSCVPPESMSEDEAKHWSRQWIDPQTTEEVRTAQHLCLTSCPALLMCRTLVDLGTDKPRGVIQAGIVYGIRIRAARGRRGNDQTPENPTGG